MRTKVHQDTIDRAAQFGRHWCHQYALDHGWTFDEVKATAERGARYATIQELSAGVAGELVQWCRARLAEEEENHD